MNKLTILVLSDFHGHFPKKFIKLSKRKDVDLIISTGDFCGNEELGELFFKHVYGKNKSLAEAIGKKKEESLEKKNFDSGARVLRSLNKLGKPVIAVTGNWDYSRWHEIGYQATKGKLVSKFYQELKKLKNIHLVDYTHFSLDDFNFVGYPRSTYPGVIPKGMIKRTKKRFGKEASAYIKRVVNDNKEFYTKLKHHFKENTIFLSHNSPYNTPLDLIKHGPQKGKHYGSYLTRKIILDLKPLLAIVGHIHENQKVYKLGKTPVVNSGAVHEGKAALIILEKKRVKSIKLLR